MENIKDLSSAENNLKALGIKSSLDTLANLVSLYTECEKAAEELEKAVSEAEKLGTALDGAKYYKNTVIPAMEKARDFADKLELKTGKKYWPFPTYEDLLFGVN